MTTTKMERQRLPFLDVVNGAAIVFIVFFHAKGAFASGIPDSYNQSISYFGLVLFTLTSAFKFHYQEGGAEGTLTYKTLIRKKIVRLVKPYYGYSLLALPFLLGLYALLSYWGDPSVIDHFLVTMRTPRTYVAFVLGENFIAWQLWYVMVLFYVYVLVGAVYLKLRETGLLVLFPILVALAYLVNQYGSPLNDVFPTNINIVLNTLQFSLVFIIGIVIAKAFTDGKRTVAYWLVPSIAAFAIIGQWLFLPPLLFFLAMCPLRNARLLNRSYLLSRYSFQIYLFHLPIILFSVSIVLIVRYGMNNLLGLLLSVGATIVLSILAYKAAKMLRLNLLFESAERAPSRPKLTP